MNTVRIRNMTLGEGIPKICVPVMGKDKEELEKAVRAVTAHEPDMVEWRADFLTCLQEVEKVGEILVMLRKILKETPLLFTIRTRREGGEADLSAGEYRRINEFVISGQMADAVDVEAFLEEETVGFLIEKAHEFQVKVIGSNHDFEKTPSKEEIVRRLCRMQDLGADVAKIAVMPKSKQDVLTLLSATEEMQEKYTKTPVITMSMGGRGTISRLAGEIFGSVLTFGMVGRASAPGQIPVGELREILEKIHQYG